ncbi:MAG: helix-turn-helix domain-containing protein [Vibrio sp.]
MSYSLANPVSGIHSKQPWFVLNADYFLTHIELNHPLISHYYSFKPSDLVNGAVAIPDGCVDIIFDCDSVNPSAQVCGTRVEAQMVELNHHHQYFGIRFLPGIFPDFIQLSPSELIHSQYDLLEVTEGLEYLMWDIVEASTFQGRVQIANEFIKGKASHYSSITGALVERICLKKGCIQVKELEQYSGYTTRTLQRMFLKDVGLSPKGFCRAIRCQSAVYEINHQNKIVFSDLAFNLGFSDQSHFLREFKKQVNATPLDYLTQVKDVKYLSRLQCL